MGRGSSTAKEAGTGVGKMNNVCEHCRAGYLGEMWRLEIGEEHLAFCGLDCIYNWSRDRWLEAVEAAREVWEK